MEELRRELCIRAHHIYKSIWNWAVGEVLVCERAPHNAADLYSIAITKGGVVVWHLPWKLPKLCSLVRDEVVQYIAQWLEHCCKFSLSENFRAFNIRIPTGHPKIFEHQKFSDLRYLEHVNWVRWQVNGNNGKVWAEAHHVTMPPSPESFVSKGHKYNPNVVPPKFLVASYAYETTLLLLPDYATEVE